MTRTGRRVKPAVAAAVVLLAVMGLSPPARADSPRPDDQSPKAGAVTPPPDTVPPRDRDRTLPTGWRTSADLAWTMSGDSTGLHVLVATAKSGYTWRTVASLAEPGFDTDMWIGNACLTGSGRRLVVVYAPRTFTNKADLFDRGGFTAVVDLRSGVVSKLPVQSSLAYFNPGCGTGEKAVVTQFGGERVDDPAAKRLESRLIAVDAARATLGRPILLPTEVSSAVPVAGGVVAAGAGRLVRVDGVGTLRGLVSTSGTAFRLAADRDGGVVFLDRKGDRVRVKRTMPRTGARVATLAEGGLTDVGLATGASGRVFLTGRPASVRSLPAAVRRLDVPMSSAISTTGALALTRVGWAGQTDPRVPTDVDGLARDVVIEARSLARGSALRFTVTPDASMSGAKSVTGRDTHPTLRRTGAKARGGARALGSPTDPIEDERYCSVPRNDPRNQAMQPKPRQVEWAVNQAITRSLAVSRPANWKNLGMPPYSPHELFPAVDLLGGGRVPAQVMLGIIAQESNMWQAPGFVLPGATGNPLIGNFYGRDIYNQNPADDWDINWADADCGYGVAQVTDRMRMAGKEKPDELPAYDYQVQRAVALDFVANVAAGVHILQTKWNQVRAAGITVNNGNPAKLENWFMAVWAYNSGFHPDLGNGEPWGVGWANNPINPRYDPQRRAFLDETYEDAKTPQKWPYPEKVMGWAGHPVEINESPTTLVSGYRAAWWINEEERTRVKPPLDLFCDQSNHCVPGMEVQPNAPGMEEEPPGPCLHTDDHDRFDLRCWYNRSVQWKGGPGTSCDTCGNEVLRFDPGYPYQDDGGSYPPNCATMPSNWRIIDDVPDELPAVRPNCPRTWTNAGTFGFQFPADAQGNYPAKVDLHQIGGGFGGHFYFGRTRTGGMHGGKLRIGATWRLNGSVTGYHRIKVAIPDHRAWTRQADYIINLGDGRTRHRVVNQAWKTNTWVDLGVFHLSGQPSVTLSTVTLDGIGEDSVAWDAVAFIPTTAPLANYVAMGDSYSSGEGVEPYAPNSDHKRDNGDKNACHRSYQAYPYLVRLPGSSRTIAQEAAEGRASFGFIACAGARTTSVTADAVNSPPSATDSAGHTDWGFVSWKYGELPQVDQGWLDEDTTLVTISIGGNDARFTDVLFGCIVVNPTEGCYADNHRLTRYSNGVVDPVELRYFEPGIIRNMLPAKLKATYRAIHAKAPNARIVVIGYPQLFPDRPFEICQGVTTTTQRFLNNLSGMLAISIAGAVADLHAEGIDITYVDPTDAWRSGVGDSSHWACPTGSAGSWTNLLINWSETGSGRDSPGAGSFHPKESGQFVLATLANLALWAPSSINAIADQFQTQAAVWNVTLTNAQAEHAARRCREVTRRGGIVGDPCVNLPVFFPSVTNAGGAARNDNEGLAMNPVWALLRYASNEEMKKIVPERRWYTRSAYQPNACSQPADPTIVDPQCDEFPFYSSEFAGKWDEFVGHTSPVSTNLKWVAKTENGAEGNQLPHFYSRCGIQTATYEATSKRQTGVGEHYIVVPLLDETQAPNTFYVCPPPA